MEYIKGLLAKQQQKPVMSLEEIDSSVDELSNVIEGSGELDTDIDELIQAEDAVQTMESLVDLVTGLTHVSSESYTSSMQVVHGLYNLAKLPVDTHFLSTEDNESATTDERKESFKERVGQNAQKVKNAIYETLKALMKTLSEFFNHYFDKLSRVKGAAEGLVDTIKPESKYEVQTDLARMLPAFGQFKSASVGIGSKLVAATRSLNVNDGSSVVEKFRAIDLDSLPDTFIGKPRFDPASGGLVVEWPKGGKDVATVSGSVMKQALTALVAVCEDTLKQKAALNGSFVTNSNASTPSDQANATGLANALKVVNRIYKTWLNYVGRVAAATVSAAKKPVTDEASPE